MKNEAGIEVLQTTTEASMVGTGAGAGMVGAGVTGANATGELMMSPRQLEQDEPSEQDGLLPASALYGLRLTRTVFEAECHSPLYLEDFIGNTLRGDFGFMLRHRACELPGGHPCRERCEQNCAYGRVFAPRLAQSNKEISPPRPYLIEPHNTLQTSYPPGAKFFFALTLFGLTRASLPFLTEVLAALGERGLGEGHRVGLGRFALTVQHTQEITEQDFARRARYLASQLAAPGSSLNLHLLRPTFINQAAQGILTFQGFWNSLVTRSKNLSQCYGGFNLDELVPQDNFKALARLAGQVVTTGDSLAPVTQPRYSGAQRRNVHAGGCVGNITFAGDLNPFLPLLAAGEWLHIGKDTVFGNGLLRLSVT